jgi:glutamate--cysteine ligase
LAESGCKPKANSVGTEHEKFAFTVADHRPVPYSKRGVNSCSKACTICAGWSRSNDNIIGTVDVTGGGAISLRAAFELYSAPYDNVHQTAAELMAHLAQCAKSQSPGHRLSARHDAELTRADMPKCRRPLQDPDAMPKVGTLGLDMMYRTCTVRANLDCQRPTWSRSCAYRSHCSRSTALFANSPFTEGQRRLSFRWKLARHRQSTRGHAARAFEDGMGFNGH